MGNSTKQVIKILYSVILCREFHENEYVNVKTAKNWGFCSKQCEASYGLFPARLQETKISFLNLWKIANLNIYVLLLAIFRYKTSIRILMLKYPLNALITFLIIYLLKIKANNRI